jgi:hypothetical protein
VQHQLFGLFSFFFQYFKDTIAYVVLISYYVFILNRSFKYLFLTHIAFKFYYAHKVTFLLEFLLQNTHVLVMGLVHVWYYSEISESQL